MIYPHASLSILSLAFTLSQALKMNYERKKFEATKSIVE